MRIVERHSHIGGYEHLLVHKPKLWAEIEDIIAKVDLTACRMKVGSEPVYDPSTVNNFLNSVLHQRGWTNTREDKISDHQLAHQHRMQFLKDRVTVESWFDKHSFIVCDLFAECLAFYVGDQIDVGIEILPMKSLQTEMSSGVPYYEKGFYDVVRQGRGVPAVPLVIVGVEP